MNLKKVIIICISILIVGSIINIAFDVRGIFQVDAAEETTIKDSFSNLEVSSDNASITILPSTNSETRVEYTTDSKQKKKNNYYVKVKGDTLFIDLKEKSWINFGINMRSAELTIYLPEKIYEEVTVSTSNGSIEANTIKGDTISFESDNGSVFLEDISGNDVYAETNNGKISLKNIKGTLEADSDNGAIFLETKNLDQHISLSTDNGSIEVKTENKPTNATITASNDLGGIDIFGSSDTSITYGKGKYQIDLDTDLGRITVR